MTLTVTKSGPGTVTDDWDRINCGTDCEGNYTSPGYLDEDGFHTHDPVDVTLRASPTGGTVPQWGGACEGRTGSTCTLSLSGNGTATVTFVDQTNPTVSLTAPANGSTVRGSVNLEATASDNVGVAGVQFSVDSSVVTYDTVAPYGHSLNTATLTDGSHTIGAQAFDTSLRSTMATPRTITVDNTAPSLSITGGTADGADLAVGSTPSYTFTASDATTSVAALECRLQGDSFASCTSGKSFPGLAAGNYVFELRATDSAGNTTTLTRAFEIDQTDPTATLTAPAASSAVRGTVQLTATATDNVAVDRVDFYRGATLVGSDSTAPYSASFDTTGVGDGPYSVSARAVDTSGRQGSASAATITVDNTGPVISITGGTANGAHLPAGSTPAFTYTTTDATSGVASVLCHLQGTAFTGCASSGTRSFPGLAPGTYVFELVATDAAGNTSTVTRQFVIDSPPGSGATGSGGAGGSSSSSTTTSATTTGGGTPPASQPQTIAEPPRILRRIVRSFRVSRRGTRIASLSVQVLDGSKVGAACRGKGCAFKRKSARMSKGVANIASLFGRKRLLRPGARIVVTVTAQDGRVAKLTILVRRGKQPKVTEA